MMDSVTAMPGKLSAKAQAAYASLPELSSLKPNVDSLKATGTQLYAKARATTVEDIKSMMTWENAYRAYNGSIAALVLYNYFTNPDAAFMEYFVDIGIHAFEALSPNDGHDLGFVMNMARFGIAFNGFFTPSLSTIPTRANLFDMGFHGINATKRGNALREEVLEGKRGPLLMSGGPSVAQHWNTALSAQQSTESEEAKPAAKVKKTQ